MKLLNSFKSSVSSACKIESVDFQGGSVVQELVNKWVEDQTHSKIRDIMTKPPEPSAKLILVNAIYFKGSWEKPFSPVATRKRQFTNYDSTVSEVDMMFNQDIYNYQKFDKFKMEVIELPYKNNCSMLVFLPPKDESQSITLKELTIDQINCMISSLEKQEVQLFMPKFVYDFEVDLKEKLMHLGLKSIFDPKSCKLDGITKELLFVSEAMHKTTIEVNEEGTVATGATFVKVMTRSLFLGPEMNVDHPFCFLILDKTTSTMLFIGCVNSL